MSGRPSLSRQIAADLRGAILRGELPPGAVLPSERELIKRYGTTKATASKVIGILLGEGLVSTEFGRGTFVRHRPALRRISAARRARRPPVSNAQAPTSRMLFVGRMATPPQVAAWLKILPGEETAVRRRLQLLDDEPVVLSTSYYPMWIAEGTRWESSEALPEGLDELIEADHPFSHGIEIFRAQMPTPEEAGLLELSPGVPVVHIWDVDYDQQGRTLLVAHDIYAADRHEFAYEWDKASTEA